MNFPLVLKFLKDLAKNNNREWFDKNKPKYLEAKESFDQIVANLLEEMIKFDDTLGGLDPKKLTFRIYRDVRFSKDKRPYKNNFGAAISSEGKGLGTPGYYFQIEPGNKSFVAIGLFQPQPEYLGKVRQEIDYNGDKLKKIFNEKKFKKSFSKFWDEDSLKKAPKGYPADHTYVEWLKLKSFVVIHEFTDSEVTDKKFMKNVIDTLKSAKPLNDFLKEAIA
ncbi:DUF2461 domain-containing protein [Ohtaekwangia koreensis]|uniref:TIGR02453 family protein n=1 Tax=Ohtaekwangia koreensis TaxID=688867 RepID=A0A1T5LME9_9BACT|nr:DUF2461 domain-containing protein [Ohtaekwangia koreensis]SKC77025.1 TIGR02453 family protein [Ohtaekwangia koreensis]